MAKQPKATVSSLPIPKGPTAKIKKTKNAVPVSKGMQSVKKPLETTGQVVSKPNIKNVKNAGVKNTAKYVRD